MVILIIDGTPCPEKASRWISRSIFRPQLITRLESNTQLVFVFPNTVYDIPIHVLLCSGRTTTLYERKSVPIASWKYFVDGFIINTDPRTTTVCVRCIQNSPERLSFIVQLSQVMSVKYQVRLVLSQKIFMSTCHT